MAQPSPKRQKLNGNGASAAEAKAADEHVPSCGAPRYRPTSGTFSTTGGITITRNVRLLSAATFTEDCQQLVNDLDRRRGCIFESSYEYPGRYSRWTMGFVDPPVAIESWERRFEVRALNTRGNVLVPAIMAALKRNAHVEKLVQTETAAPAGAAKAPLLLLSGNVVDTAGKRFSEEERSKQPSIFSVVRAIVQLFGVEAAVDPQLGLYGAFGYDLTFQFEPVRQKHKRDGKQRDLLLYIPDAVMVLDGPAKQAWRIEYDFDWGGESTAGRPREGEDVEFRGVTEVPRRRDHEPGAYAKKVEKAKEQFKVGNLFETVLSQVFYEPCSCPPSEILARLRERNPSPYMFVLNLGRSEFLVGASPEMFVRVEMTPTGQRVETCPISGTIRRGRNALEDAERIKEILTNKKEESELTMCTDVDRNDKSRVCRPGSVRVIGRRQIEKYSKLIHTVDHVEGYLRDGFDALDAFLVHTWAVTVTGAPKPWAIQFVEDNEETPRAWYAGAVGLVGFDGHLNTGLTLRTIHIDHGVASVRAGATLLYDSDPAAEEKETELKASAFRDAILRPRGGGGGGGGGTAAGPMANSTGIGRRVLLVDHQDSFVHTLGNYLRQTGAAVETVRFGISKQELAAHKPDLVVLSPGPGKPDDFKLSDTIKACVELNLPVFGVCLGLQGIVEHFGGTLGVLGYPMHGKPSLIRTKGAKGGAAAAEGAGGIFQSLPGEFVVARYHSLYALPDKVPSCLSVTAETVPANDQHNKGSGPIIMAVQHNTLPIAAVQFHPESILTNPAYGLSLMANVFSTLCAAKGK